MIGFLATLGLATAHNDLLSVAQRTLFADLRDGLLVIDNDGRIVEMNQSAEAVLGRAAAATIGLEARSVLVGPLETVLSDVAQHGEPITLTPSNATRPVNYTLRNLPLVDANGAIVGRLVSLHAPAAYHPRQSLPQATFLADASAMLGSTLDYDLTLQQVARLAIPVLGDWCTVYMLEDDGAVRRVAVAFADGERAELAAALRRYPPSPISPRSTVAQVMRSGQPIITPTIPDAYVSAIAQDAAHLEIMRRLDFRSSMTVPLLARGVVLGAVAIFTSDPHRAYDENDLALAHDLAQRGALAIDNARLYREAQRAIRSRDEFLSVAAHELKTPLTSILGFTQLLLRGLTPGQAPNERLVDRALRALESQSERLARLVGRLLDIARIEGGRLAIEARLTDLVPLVRGVVDAVRMTRPTCAFDVRAPSALVATVDPVRIEQVLTNLLDNAARYSATNATVHVELSRVDAHAARLSVTDHGEGIPIELRDRIFDRFFQADSGQHTSGMGLGLYICREIVEQHGGSIAIEAPDEGGSRFVVTLPLRNTTP